MVHTLVVCIIVYNNNTYYNIYYYEDIAYCEHAKTDQGSQTLLQESFCASNGLEKYVCELTLEMKKLSNQYLA